MTTQTKIVVVFYFEFIIISVKLILVRHSQVLLALLLFCIDLVLIQLIFFNVLIDRIYPYFPLHKAKVLTASATCPFEPTCCRIFHLHIDATLHYRVVIIELI